MGRNGPRWLSLETFRAAVADKQDLADAAVRCALVADEIKTVEGDERSLDITISTEKPDRDRDIIMADGWDFRNFKKNPVVLFAHDYYSLPIARASALTIDAGKVHARASFVPAEIYPFAETVLQMLKGRYLNAASVGFKPKKYQYNEERRGVDYAEQELLEFSIVPVPANADCLVEARSAGIDVEPLREWAEKTLERFGQDRVPERFAALGKIVQVVEKIGDVSRTYSFATDANNEIRLPIAIRLPIVPAVAKGEHADCTRDDCPMRAATGGECSMGDTCPMRAPKAMGQPEATGGVSPAAASVVAATVIQVVDADAIEVLDEDIGLDAIEADEDDFPGVTADEILAALRAGIHAEAESGVRRAVGAALGRID